jgi:hypothetical protein
MYGARNHAANATARNVIVAPMMSRTNSEPLWENERDEQVDGDQQGDDARGDVGGHYRSSSSPAV